MTHKVLIVDDDEEMCEEMAEILRDEGYQVATAFDGLEGSKQVKTEPYEVVLLDLKIPGITGFDILKMIKEERKLPSRVIILTGRPLMENDFEGQAAAKGEEERILGLADNVINKPFDVEQVLAAIRALVPSS